MARIVPVSAGAFAPGATPSSRRIPCQQARTTADLVGDSTPAPAWAWLIDDSRRRMVATFALVARSAR